MGLVPKAAVLPLQDGQRCDRMQFEHVVSLGYQCMTAHFIRETGLRRHMSPFDWLFSTPLVVEHCMKDEFADFLDQENYVSCGSGQQWSHRIFDALYDKGVLFNHHDMSDPDMHARFRRSARRFTRMLRSDAPKMFVIMSSYKNIIHPVTQNFIGRIGDYTQNFRVVAIGVDSLAAIPEARISALRETTEIQDLYEVSVLSTAAGGLEFEDSEDNSLIRGILQSYRYDLPEGPDSDEA